jgi:hypothetical protein
MSNRRRGRPKTRGSWTPEASAKAHAAKERKRLAGPAPERETQKVPVDTLLGVLQWTASAGDVHRITVRQGARANQIRVKGCKKDHGFDWLLRKLRGKVSGSRRLSNGLDTPAGHSPPWGA